MSDQSTAITQKLEAIAKINPLLNLDALMQQGLDLSTLSFETVSSEELENVTKSWINGYRGIETQIKGMADTIKKVFKTDNPSLKLAQMAATIDTLALDKDEKNRRLTDYRKEMQRQAESVDLEAVIDGELSKVYPTVTLRAGNYTTKWKLRTSKADDPAKELKDTMKEFIKSHEPKLIVQLLKDALEYTAAVKSTLSLEYQSSISAADESILGINDILEAYQESEKAKAKAEAEKREAEAEATKATNKAKREAKAKQADKVAKDATATDAKRKVA